MNLYLRKVIHPQAHDNYRVILKLGEGEFEIGSIGIQHGGVWAWGIDIVIPMFARQGAEIDALYARIVRRGGTHKCTGCGHEVRSACDCGRAYIATGPHAESESEMRHENRHENRHEIGHENPRRRGRLTLNGKPMSNAERLRA